LSIPGLDEVAKGSGERAKRDVGSAGCRLGAGVTEAEGPDSYRRNSDQGDNGEEDDETATGGHGDNGTAKSPHSKCGRMA
jgi:hypothetical protein